MKKKSILIIFLSLVFLVSCSNESGSKVSTGEEKLKVYISNYPLYDFTKSITGDLIEVINIRQNSGVHGWEPSAKDIADLNKGDMFIYSGSELESWADNLIDEGSIGVNIVDASEGLELLESDHDHDDHDEHEHEDDHDDHDHGQYDPHIWLSLRNAETILENIERAVSELDSENQEKYKENLNSYLSQLKELDEEYTKKLSDNKRDAIIVSHEAYAYLCRDYNFKQVGIEGVLAEGEPSVAQIDNIIKVSRELDAKTIFYEETISPKVANLIAEEVGASLELLSPIETLSPEQEKNGENYLTIMKSNLEGIYKALNE